MRDDELDDGITLSYVSDPLEVSDLPEAADAPEVSGPPEVSDLPEVSDPPEAQVRADSDEGGGIDTSTSASTPAADLLCEICGRRVGADETLCGACAELTASSERDDG